MEAKDFMELALETGFDHVGELNMGALEFRQEVRDMCAGGTCQAYGKRWTCPPYCGTLEESRRKAARYRKGILVQTTGVMEDDFDYEAMLETEKRHKENFSRLIRALRSREELFLPMGAGGCRVCKECTCPDAPCRFPEKAVTSMEAYGLLVADTCRASGLPYNYGQRTMTFTSAVLYGTVTEAEAAAFRT